MYWIFHSNCDCAQDLILVLLSTLCLAVYFIPLLGSTRGCVLNF